MATTNTKVIDVDWPVLPQRKEWSNGGAPTAGSARATRGRAAIATASLEGNGKEVEEAQYEYLDHTADVQLHAWGPNLGAAFGSCAVAMFGYMCTLSEFSADFEVAISAEGHDMESLLFNFLDECLYTFHADSFVMVNVRVTKLDIDNYTIRAVARGGIFEHGKHSQGTEVKAITYSNMKIDNEPSRADVYVIVDI